MEIRIQLDINMVVAMLKERFGEGLKGFGFDLSEGAPMIELDLAHNEVNDVIGIWVSQKRDEEASKAVLKTNTLHSVIIEMYPEAQRRRRAVVLQSFRSALSIVFP